MTADEELNYLLAHPQLSRRFSPQPLFSELMKELEEFGKPLFELRDRQSFCYVSVASALGEEIFVGRVSTQANPSGAGLACLIKLLERYSVQEDSGYLDAFSALYPKSKTAKRKD